MAMCVVRRLDAVCSLRDGCRVAVLALRPSPPSFPTLLAFVLAECLLLSLANEMCSSVAICAIRCAVAYRDNAVPLRDKSATQLRIYRDKRDPSAPVSHPRSPPSLLRLDEWGLGLSISISFGTPDKFRFFFSKKKFTFTFATLNIMKAGNIQQA